MRIISESPEHTATLGVILGRLLRSGDLIFLSGELGAGKTHFVRGVAMGMGVTDHVSSPTFGLINVYDGPITLYHLDLYRLNSKGDLAILDLPGMMEDEGVFAIEWGEMIQQEYSEYLEVVITYGDGLEQRMLEWRPRGERYQTLCEELKREYADFRD